MTGRIRGPDEGGGEPLKLQDGFFNHQMAETNITEHICSKTHRF